MKTIYFVTGNMRKLEEAKRWIKVAEEKKIMNKFFELLSTKPNMVAYGEKEVEQHLNNGIVDVLLVSEDLEEEKEALEKANADLYKAKADESTGNSI